MANSEASQGRSRRISRRTILQGAGAAMALPWLESIPVWGTEINSAGEAPITPKRFAALFMACGVNPKHWWAKGSGNDLELGKSLQPMEKLKTKMNYVEGLFNKSATGVGIHPWQTGNILSGASLQKGAELRGGISVDQMLANYVGQETSQASLVPPVVTGLRTADNGLPRDEFLDGVQLSYLVAKRHFASPDGGLPVAGLRQLVRQ